MTGLRVRAVQMLGVLCLLGQGTLLFVGSRGHLEPGLALPGVFLLLTIVLALVLAWELRRLLRMAGGQGRTGILLTSGLLLATVGVLLACGLSHVLHRVQSSGPGPSTPAGSNVAIVTARQDLESYPAALEDFISRIRQDNRDDDHALRRGGLFRAIEDWPDLWARSFVGSEALPVQAVLHRAGQTVSWTEGAEPLTPQALAHRDSIPDASFHLIITKLKDHWFLLAETHWRDDLQLELQFPLSREIYQKRWPGVLLQVTTGDQVPVIVDDQGNAVADIILGDTQGDLALIPQLAHPDFPGRDRARSARVMLLLGASWLLTLVMSARMFFQSWGLLVGLWLGRSVLAAVDYFRWTGPAFPEIQVPAPPDHVISLVGPAYFATPFAWGWFASVADAFLSAIVIGLTTWAVLRSWKMVGQSPGPGAASFSWTLLGQGPVSGLVFGLGATLVLAGLRFFAGLVAENANPRLVGQGVSLDFLSFWGLHVVLMLISFSLASLVTGWAGQRAWPSRDKLGAWLAGAAMAALVGAVVFWVWDQPWPGLPYLGALVVAGFWLVAPSFRSRPRFLRRFAWPAVLLLAVVWNYASLRGIYDRAERNWIESKSQQIVGSGEDWTRFLLEDALLGMRDADGQVRRSVSSSGIWRDEPAFQLWSASPLRDLGYACLVEISSPEKPRESLFATGFMRDGQYEVLRRGMWTNSQGIPSDNINELAFQVEIRGYPGGEEEILVGRIARLGGEGWIHLELPLRSWRVSTLLADLRGEIPSESGYKPRSEVDRPILFLHGDGQGWLGTGDPGFDSGATARRVDALKSGQREWAILRQGNDNWLCRWNPLKADTARLPGEGFLLGLRRSSIQDNLLDLSRLMLVNLFLLFLLYAMVQLFYGLASRGHISTPNGDIPGRWLPGFQERFLSGYLILGFLLLLVVGTSVDRVGHDRVRVDSRQQTRQGLVQAVTQLRSLLVEQARSFAASDYLNKMLQGEFSDERMVGSQAHRQGMVFYADGTLILDETLSDLNEQEALDLLAAGRSNPLILIREEQNVFVATVIPIDVEVGPEDTEENEGDPDPRDGFFLYRQRLESDLLEGLADLVQGQATLRIDGQPFLASHPGPIFAGHTSLLAAPRIMASLLDHPDGPGVFSRSGRPFAFTGSQPLPVFARDQKGNLSEQPIPGVLTLSFPDREQQFVDQRRKTVLFLAGLANLILLTALLLALGMSWNLFRPLRVLLDATRSLAQGDFDAPLPDAGKDEVGRLTEAFGLMRAELHGARESLAAREQFLTTVLDQVTVGVAVLDGSGQVVALNPAGRHILTDFQPELSEEDGARALRELFEDQARGNPRWGGELRSVAGHSTLRGAMAPLQLPDGNSDTMLVFEDITEFLQTKKMAINAELARQVAHEIKNPLTPIQLSIQLLDQAWRDQHPQLDSIVTETVSRVLAQVDLLRTIASEFSLLGRPGQLELEPLDLPEVVGQVVDRYLAGTFDEDQGFKVHLASQEVPLIAGEPNALQKILGNLMQNSLDAARQDVPLVIDIGWDVSDSQVTLIWRDNGQGLQAEVADRLFDPYFSTKSKGTGLGLAICRNLADRMGGVMTLDNRRDGPGARATLTLPRI